MATVQSVVLRERGLHEINPALGSQHSDLHHHFIVVHLSDGKAKTVEYGHFAGDSKGTIHIKDGAETMHAMVEAHEYETSPGYAWSSFEKFILHDSGYQNTTWTRDHQSETFIKVLMQHLSTHCKHPAHILAAKATEKLDLKAPDADAIKVFETVKNHVIKKVHELHKSDAIHHTHMFDQQSHLDNYKLVQHAVKPVDYGFIYFGKIDIGNKHFLHVRAHKYHDVTKPVTFHALRITRDTAIWSDKATLIYFDAVAE